MKKLKFTLIFLVFFVTMNGQEYWIAGEQYDKIDFKKITSTDPTQYVGVYHLGMSEWESDLFINSFNGEIIAQLKYSEWLLDNEGRAIGIKYIYINLKNVQLNSGYLSSDKLKGYFVNVNYENKVQSAILCTETEINMIEKNEFGIKLTDSFKDYYVGKYPYSSYRLLTEMELRNLSDLELKIMRNEIFARYGYKFKSGEEMEKYFEKQSWYHAVYDNVNDFVTDLEKANIDLILKFEKK